MGQHPEKPAQRISQKKWFHDSWALTQHQGSKDTIVEAFEEDFFGGRSECA